MFKDSPEGQTYFDPVEEMIGQFVRDVCTVEGRSKSECRRRLKDIIATALLQENIRMREELDEEIRAFREGFAYKPKK